MASIIRDTIFNVYSPHPDLKNKYQVIHRNGFVYYKNEKEVQEIQPSNSNFNHTYDISDLITLSSTSDKSVNIDNLDLDTGFVRPYYKFIESEFNPAYKAEEAYSHTLGKFDLNSDSILSPDDFVKFTSYRDSLFKQIKRQLFKITEINNEIISILEVLLMENEGFEFLKDLSAIQDVLTELFVQNELFTGAYSTKIDLCWINNLTGKTDLHNHLKITSLKAIESLLKDRDQVIVIAVKLANLIQPVESLIENAITGNKLLSPREYLFKNLPNTETVAQKFISSARNSVYPLSDINNVMAAFLKFYIDNQDIIYKRMLNSIGKRILSDENINWTRRKPSINTVKSWIVCYAKEIKVTF